jgi:hypothetical protein
MNRKLAAAVIATFRDGDESASPIRLYDFRTQDWRRSLHWLDASGLALYFLDRIKTLRLVDALPSTIVYALESRLRDNQTRTAYLFDEFLRINRAFQGADLQYVNLKGFTLVPDYCPDPSLRRQFDIDFLAETNDARQYSDILKRFGYIISGRGEHLLEFKAGPAQLPTIEQLYKATPHHSVEVHFIPASIPMLKSDRSLLARSQQHVYGGETFAALSRTDIFLAQAQHLFRHVKSEWTRISWLLELKTFITSRATDAGFWQDVRLGASALTDGALSVGVAAWLASEAFGQFAPPALTEWSVDTIPTSVRLWLERYGRKVLLSDFPGSKLYLLLDGELSQDRKLTNPVTLKKLLPLHLPPRVTSEANRGIGQKIRTVFVQARYMFFRLRFHLAEGARYLFEAWRWRRLVSSPGLRQA